MNIIKLEGGDKRLYYLVAHLVMNEEVLAYNLNYPYKTASNYVWFIAADDDNILGFIPARLEEGQAKVNNYYVAGDDSAVFSALLEELVNTLSLDYEIESVTQLRHVPYFERNSFSVTFYWKRYAKMKVLKISGGEEERI
ncbi:MAG: hypothetical protein LBL33_00310 [Tannerella sp.]|jgi:hypothetical protein|nr:hypothetical protein [Tannerella sp.]